MITQNMDICICSAVSLSDLRNSNSLRQTWRNDMRNVSSHCDLIMVMNTSQKSSLIIYRNKELRLNSLITYQNKKLCLKCIVIPFRFFLHFRATQFIYELLELTAIYQVVCLVFRDNFLF